MLKKTLEDGIVIVTFENGKTNPITLYLMKELHEAIREVNTTESRKGLILTGTGRFFSSGFDLPVFLGFKDEKEAEAFFLYEEEFLIDLFTCQKPVVTAINGHAAAGGLIFAMAGDYRIVKDHPKIKIGMSEIKIGVPLTITQTEIMRFGLDSDKKFRDVMYFGEMMDVTRASQLEIVDEVVAEEHLLDRAKQVVTTWIDTPERPFIQLKHTLRWPVVERIRHGLATENWQKEMARFFNPRVREVLQFVQMSMQ